MANEQHDKVFAPPPVPLYAINSQSGSDIPSLNALIGRTPSTRALETGKPIRWVITDDLKRHYGALFSRAPKANSLLMSGLESRTYFSKSGLDSNDLAKIWKLCDRDQDKALNKSEFSLFMYLVQAKIAKIDIPTELPQELIDSYMDTQEAPVAPKETQDEPSTTNANVNEKSEAISEKLEAKTEVKNDVKAEEPVPVSQPDAVFKTPSKGSFSISRRKSAKRKSSGAKQIDAPTTNLAASHDSAIAGTPSDASTPKKSTSRKRVKSNAAESPVRSLSSSTNSLTAPTDSEKTEKSASDSSDNVIHTQILKSKSKKRRSSQSPKPAEQTLKSSHESPLKSSRDKTTSVVTTKTRSRSSSQPQKVSSSALPKPEPPPEITTSVRNRNTDITPRIGTNLSSSNPPQIVTVSASSSSEFGGDEFMVMGSTPSKLFKKPSRPSNPPPLLDLIPTPTTTTTATTPLGNSAETPATPIIPSTAETSDDSVDEDDDDESDEEDEKKSASQSDALPLRKTMKWADAQALFQQFDSSHEGNSHHSVNISGGTLPKIAASTHDIGASNMPFPLRKNTSKFGGGSGLIRVGTLTRDDTFITSNSGKRTFGDQDLASGTNSQPKSLKRRASLDDNLFGTKQNISDPAPPNIKAAPAPVISATAPKAPVKPKLGIQNAYEIDLSAIGLPKDGLKKPRTYIQIFYFVPNTQKSDPKYLKSKNSWRKVVIARSPVYDRSTEPKFDPIFLLFDDLHEGLKTEFAIEVVRWKFPKPEVIGVTGVMSVDDLVYAKPKKQFIIHPPNKSKDGGGLYKKGNVGQLVMEAAKKVSLPAPQRFYEVVFECSNLRRTGFRGHKAFLKIFGTPMRVLKNGDIVHSQKEVIIAKTELLRKSSGEGTAWEPVVIDLQAVGGFLGPITIKLYSSGTSSSALASNSTPLSTSPSTVTNSILKSANDDLSASLPHYLGKVSLNLREIFTETTMRNFLQQTGIYTDIKKTKELPQLIFTDSRRLDEWGYKYSAIVSVKEVLPLIDLTAGSGDTTASTNITATNVNRNILSDDEKDNNCFTFNCNAHHLKSHHSQNVFFTIHAVPLPPFSYPHHPQLPEIGKWRSEDYDRQWAAIRSEHAKLARKKKKPIPAPVPPLIHPHVVIYKSEPQSGKKLSWNPITLHSGDCGGLDRDLYLNFFAYKKANTSSLASSNSNILAPSTPTSVPTTKPRSNSLPGKISDEIQWFGHLHTTLRELTMKNSVLHILGYESSFTKENITKDPESLVVVGGIHQKMEKGSGSGSANEDVKGVFAVDGKSGIFQKYIAPPLQYSMKFKMSGYASKTANVKHHIQIIGIPYHKRDTQQLHKTNPNQLDDHVIVDTRHMGGFDSPIQLQLWETDKKGKEYCIGISLTTLRELSLVSSSKHNTFSFRKPYAENPKKKSPLPRLANSFHRVQAVTKSVLKCRFIVEQFSPMVVQQTPTRPRGASVGASAVPNSKIIGTPTPSGTIPQPIPPASPFTVVQPGYFTIGADGTPAPILSSSPPTTTPLSSSHPASSSLPTGIHSTNPVSIPIPIPRKSSTNLSSSPADQNEAEEDEDTDESEDEGDKESDEESDLSSAEDDDQ